MEGGRKLGEHEKNGTGGEGRRGRIDEKIRECEDGREEVRE